VTEPASQDRVIRQFEPLASRFWRCVEIKSAGECWLWRGAVQRGYGAFHLTLPGVSRRMVNAQRVAFVLTFGPINADDHVLHRCDTPLCCNPSHLFIGDRSANMTDAARKGRMSGAYPQRGVRTSVATKELIATRLSEGGAVRAIAREAGVSPITVRRVRGHS
jgi:hypothetical protein